MPESKHTPGPWGVYHPSEFPQDWRIARVGAPAGERVYVGRLTTSHDPQRSGDGGGGLQPVREADARLIAAAPDAVALAEAVAAHFEGTDAPLGQMARDWLAKARGE